VGGRIVKKPARRNERMTGGMAKDKRAQAGKTVAASETKDRQFVTALGRGFDVLTCFARARTDLGTMEIARMTGLPQPTVWRLCHTLVQLGYLTKAGNSEKLRLGIPVLGLGYAVLAEQTISQLATPYMQELADQCGGAVALGARDGKDIIYLQRCRGRSVLLADLQVGAHVPVAKSATGWGYLAGLPAGELTAFFAEAKRDYGKDWTALKAAIARALADYEKTGLVLGIGVMHPEINSVAVPVMSPDGAQVLTLSCGGIASVFSEKVLRDLGPNLIKLSKILSMALPGETPRRG
jgi:DNA-binding IclR family transcriptional regulator